MRYYKGSQEERQDYGDCGENNQQSTSEIHSEAPPQQADYLTSLEGNATRKGRGLVQLLEEARSMETK
ncbi:MAG: hypothetical protein ACP5KV_01110 [Candidatus Methanomethylicaceae archaeon]